MNFIVRLSATFVLVLDAQGEHLNRPPVAPGPSPSANGDPVDRAEWAKLCNLQRRILARTAPPVAGYRLELAYRPAFAVTGDYHDFFDRPDGTLAAFIGDGSGHGPAASMLMAMMLTLLRTHEIHGEPGETLSRAGHMFHRLIPSDLFMTGVYLHLYPNGLIRWAAAGHHPPLHVEKSGVVKPIDLTLIGPALGIEPTSHYATVQDQMEVGDRCLLFTDGLWDARNAAGEPFSRFRLGLHMQYTMDDPLEDVVRGLVAAVTQHLSGSDFEDDFTILAVERVG